MRRRSSEVFGCYGAEVLVISLVAVDSATLGYIVSNGNLNVASPQVTFIVVKWLILQRQMRGK